jgi:hypothetical protein
VANKAILILPTAGSNKCTGGGNSVFYRLRAAFRGAGISVQGELGWTLMEAAKAGWTLDKIGYTLAAGVSPATVRTIRNLVSGKTLGETERQHAGRAIAESIERAADCNTAGEINFYAGRGQHSLSDHLIRFLRPWLRPGTGGGSRVNFNPDSMVSCMGDEMKPRPPAIGLVHELCHAWRNAAGQRLFDDALSCGLDDDEVMTTGFPPYQYEKFSENLFRSVWPTRLEMRLNDC